MILNFRFAFVFVFISLSAHADFMKCTGNISFWAQQGKTWRQIKLKDGEIYETNHNRTGQIQIGEYQKFPAVVVYPFFGILAKVINKKVEVDTDKDSYFKVFYENRLLVCNVKRETAP